ncbi:MAG: TetR/AcrR family transcriptional regulator C-terminal domain-containing protein [Hyphomicrobiaceae bacterium]
MQVQDAATPHAKTTGTRTNGNARRGGRLAAGTDPRKRRQILDGATTVFKKMGFDAASMADVAAKATVSKATLYVYFPSKEELFAAVISEERDRNIGTVVELLDPNRAANEVLFEFGLKFAQIVSQPHVVQAQRIVFGVCKRMPEIGKQMFDAGYHRVAHALAVYLTARSKAGDLKLDDAEFAAVQFLELCQASIIRPRLYSAIDGSVDDVTARRVVGSAVAMILNFYKA